MIAQGHPPRSWSSLTERTLDQAQRLGAIADAAPERLMVTHSRAVSTGSWRSARQATRPSAACSGSRGPCTRDRLEATGYRLIGLTHFFDNETGGSLHGTSSAGLSDFGHRLVTEMIRRDMVSDLAHASPRMARDVLAIPGAVPIVSHTGIRSHCDSPRNVEDAILKALAAKGGLVGIGFWPDITCGATFAAIAASIKAAVALLGPDHAALGQILRER